MTRASLSLFKLRILYDFLGFEAHVRQIRERQGKVVPKIWYERPAYFIGNSAPEKIFGSGPVTIPAFVKQPDYECNGEVRTGANTNTAYWGFAKILAFLGRENIGVEENGDVVTLKSEKIGALTNTVRISHV